MDVFAEVNISIPKEKLNRVHQIGRIPTINGIINQVIIAKFACWSDNIAAYRIRKKLNRKVLRLDLTPKRAEHIALLKKKIKLSSGIASFAFIDINWELIKSAGRAAETRLLDLFNTVFSTEKSQEIGSVEWCVQYSRKGKERNAKTTEE